MMDRKAAVSCVHRHRHRCHQHTALPPSVSTTGTGEDACVSVPFTGQEPLRKVVTVVTEVIVPQTGRTSAAGVTDLRRREDSSVMEDIATTV